MDPESGTPLDEASAIEARARAMGEAIGIREERPKRGWFTRAVSACFKRRLARPRAAAAPSSDVKTASERAKSEIRWACVKSAFTGAATGALSTAATVLTAQTEGALGFVTIPLAAAAMGGEMLLRTVIHVNLTCDLAEVFEVRFDPDDEDDLWRLYGLAFGAHESETDANEDNGKGLVAELTKAESEEVGEKLGYLIVGESVMRNIVPFVGIVTSAVTNVIVTRRLGNTVRRYMRYQRGMHDALAHAQGICHAHLDLLIEGMWFIFTADGKLVAEETACLAHLLAELDPITRRAVTERFTDDESDWMARVTREIPEAMKDAFLHALEVAAALDKSVELPERKILRNTANALGRKFDPAHVELMIAEFEDRGVLTAGAAHHRVGGATSSP